MNKSLERTKKLLQEIRDKIQDLNEELEIYTLDELRQANLQTRYWFGGGGSPHAGQGFKPIISVNKEHERAKALQRNIDYDAYRKMLRGQKVSEPEIWSRFPAITVEEHQEKQERLARYEATRNALRKSFSSPFEKFCEAEARRRAKQEKCDPAIFLTDKAFIESCKLIWEIEL